MALYKAIYGRKFPQPYYGKKLKKEGKLEMKLYDKEVIFSKGLENILVV